MRKIDKDYSFTEREIQALMLICTIGREDWLTKEVKEILSQYISRKMYHRTASQVFAHRKRVLGSFPSNAGKYLLERRTSFIERSPR